MHANSFPMFRSMIWRWMSENIPFMTYNPSVEAPMLDTIALALFMYEKVVNNNNEPDSPRAMRCIAIKKLSAEKVPFCHTLV